MKTAIITDSAANLSKDFVKKEAHLYVLPLMILSGDKQYRDQVEISAEEVYEQIDEKNFTTSLPSMDDFTKMLDTIKKKEYEQVIIISISSGLSGTFNAMRLLIKDYKGLNITHYDTKTLGSAQGYLVEEALNLAKKGSKPETIIKALDTLRYEDSIAIYTIDTLKYLRKGGRIGKVEGTVGNLLRVKPIITVNDEGVYITLSKSIGSIQRALLNMKKLLVEKFNDELIELTIHYGDGLEKAKDLGEKLKKELNIKRLRLSALTPVLGIHTGPKMFAYVARRTN